MNIISQVVWTRLPKGTKFHDASYIYFKAQTYIRNRVG